MKSAFQLPPGAWGKRISTSWIVVSNAAIALFLAFVRSILLTWPDVVTVGFTVKLIRSEVLVTVVAVPGLVVLMPNCRPLEALASLVALSKNSRVLATTVSPVTGSVCWLKTIL